jgi:hypothetical protein
MRIAKTRSKQIGEYEYVVVPLPAGEGNEVFRRLLRLLGGGLEKLGGSDVSAALGGLFQALTAEDQQYVVATLCKQTQVKQASRVMPLSDCFGEHFAGCMDEQLEWIFFSLEVNFGSVIKKAKAAASGDGAAAKIASLLRSQTASGGQPTGSPRADDTTIRST